MRARNFPWGEQELKIIFEKAGLPLRFLDKRIEDLSFAEDESRKNYMAKKFKSLEAYRKNIEENLKHGTNLFLVSDDRFLGDGVATILAKDILVVLLNWNLEYPPIYYLSFCSIQDLIFSSSFDSDAKAKRDLVFKSQVLIFSEIDLMLKLGKSNPKFSSMLSSVLKERNSNLKTSIFVSTKFFETLSKDFEDVVSILKENCIEIGLLPKKTK